MVKYYKITKFEFKLGKIKSGIIPYGDYKGLTSRIDVRLNRKAIITKDFELTSTIKQFYNGILNLLKIGYDEDEYFCCTCGDHGCAYINWEMKLKNDEIIIIKMEDLLGKPIGQHYYSVNKKIFVKGVIQLFDKVIVFIKKHNLKNLSEGTLKDFEKMKQEILSYNKRDLS